ncbi:MAG: hypothetical protein NC211_02565 [Alistipes senegalensis]|nr:hypothetical protein [Oxalobacter formigenes]MCM1280708.1 hypothetical protein [Alistipes senegalensis]
MAGCFSFSTGDFLLPGVSWFVCSFQASIAGYTALCGYSSAFSVLIRVMGKEAGYCAGKFPGGKVATSPCCQKADSRGRQSRY